MQIASAYPNALVVCWAVTKTIFENYLMSFLFHYIHLFIGKKGTFWNYLCILEKKFQ